MLGTQLNRFADLVEPVLSGENLLFEEAISLAEHGAVSLGWMTD
jgi:hypothetical protein